MRYIGEVMMRSGVEPCERCLTQEQKNVMEEGKATDWIGFIYMLIAGEPGPSWTHWWALRWHHLDYRLDNRCRVNLNPGSQPAPMFFPVASGRLLTSCLISQSWVTSSSHLLTWIDSLFQFCVEFDVTHVWSSTSCGTHPENPRIMYLLTEEWEQCKRKKPWSLWTFEASIYISSVFSISLLFLQLFADPECRMEKGRAEWRLDFIFDHVEAHRDRCNPVNSPNRWGYSDTSSKSRLRGKCYCQRGVPNQAEPM